MPNALRESNSPYLLQHADNPVEWMEWGSPVFETARSLDRPILLSIGYSACHWCHVMAHESFENNEIAAVMNENFVNVKVDREERPDIDAVYMNAVQAMTGHGGWPLTVFLTPAGEPFYGGTYFPPTSRHGMVGFEELLMGVAEAWRGRRDEVQASAEGLVGLLRKSAASKAQVAITRDAIDRAAHAMLRSIDQMHGGFGGHPKFPNAANLRFLLMHGARTGDPNAIAAVSAAMDGMSAGGILDQLGGGFHRYSVDASWTVPHFEKMLYDNAQLIDLLVATWSVTGHDRFLAVADGVVDWALSEMVGPEGGFFATQDADTSDGEGYFFSWSRAELDDALGAELGALAATWYGVSDHGTFERGRSVLTRSRSADQLAADRGVSTEALHADLEVIRSRLLDARDRRERPATDTKVVTEWNGLMIDALARGAVLTGREKWLEAARRAADFVLGPMRDSDGELVHSWREGRSGGPAFLEDYMVMARAAVSLWNADFDPQWLEAAWSLTRTGLDRFGDDGEPGVLLRRSGTLHETLIIEEREIGDGSTPSGNALAADVLWRLGALLQDPGLIERSERIVEHGLAIAANTPLAVGASLSVATELVDGIREIAVFSPGGHDDPLLRAARGALTPGVVVAWSPGPVESHMVPWLAGRPMPNGRPVAYVCSDMTCGPPIHDTLDLLAALRV